MTHQIIDFTYEVKCRSCGKVSEMWVQNSDNMKYTDFVKVMNEKASYPVEKQCNCHNGKMFFHDVISYSPVH